MTRISDYKARRLKQVQEASTPLPSDANKMLELAGSDELIKGLIDKLLKPDTPPADQLSAMNALGAVGIFSKVLPTRSADLTNALRGLINSTDAEVRRQALSYLSLMGDEIAHQHLRDELVSDKPEAGKSVPTHQAIAMLGVHEKGIDKKQLLAIAKNPPDDKSLVQAVRHLPADAETSSVLIKILQDDQKPIAARVLVPEIVNNVDPGGFATVAKKVLQKEGANSEIAPFIARGVASIQTDQDQVQEEMEETKSVIRSLAPTGPIAFKEAARPLTSNDDSAEDD